MDSAILPAAESDAPRDERPGGPATRLGWPHRHGAMIVLALSLALNLAGNARTSLWDRDEPRFAVCVREMRARHDWVFPTFNGEPRYHKPILIYWLMGLATAVVGDNPFGARLVSALAGSAASLVVWGLGRRLIGPRGALLSALIFATAPIVVAESKLATTDAALCLWLVGAQACLWTLGRRPSRAAAAGFWALMALAILTKGPIGPALIGASVLVGRLLGWPLPPRERFQWRWGILGLLAVTAPWYVAISIISHGDFLRFAVGRQLVHRITNDMETHGGFPGYYPALSALVFCPWSALVPAALAAAWPRRKTNPDLAFLLGWILGPLVVLECVQTKLIHYALPIFPACSLLVAWLMSTLAREGVSLRDRALGRWALVFLVGSAAVLTAALLAGAALALAPSRAPLIVAALVLTCGTAAARAAFRAGDNPRATYGLAATWAALLLVIAGWLVPSAEGLRPARVVGERLAALSERTGLTPVLLEYQEPGVIYALGRPVALTRDRDGFFAHLEGGRAVVTVLLANEIDVMRSHFGLDVQPVESINGFVHTKGKRQQLHLAIVRLPNAPAPNIARGPETPGISR